MNITFPQYNTYTKTQINTLYFKGLPPKYTKVDEYLIRGSHPSIKDLVQLKKEGVNQIFDFRHLSNFGYKFIEKYFCKLCGIKYTRVPYSNLYGEYPDLSTFEKIALQVKENGEKGGKTLFHCNSGRHRTSHFAAFYKLTKGEPLQKVMQKEDYLSVLNKVVNEEIIAKDYFSRHLMEYDGKNIIKQILINYNNKIFEGIKRAHNIFLSSLQKPKDL